MNTNGRARVKQPDVATSFSELAHDVIELGELQAQLFAIDVKSTVKKTGSSVLLSAIGVCVLLGTVPVLLFALGYLFHEVLEWPVSAGLGIAAAVGIVVSAIILLLAWSRLSAGLNSMQRSSEELRRNIAWIKSTLKSRQSAAPTMDRPVTAPTNPR
jgi:H+/Cl- antiporter ClcA